MPLILGTNSIKDTGNVANSLRFNTASSDYLNRTNTGAGNRKTFTYSFWVKRSTLGTDQRIIEASTDTSGNYVDAFEFTADDIRVVSYHAADIINLITDRKFRDPNAWYHVVVAIDTTQGTEANRVKLYINGVQETSFSTANYPDQDQDLYFNNNNDEVYIGRRIDNGGSPSGEYIGCYLSEFVLIDGLQLTPTSFGEFDSDSGIWKPINVSGLTFGTNGFYLEFKQSGTSQNSSGLGADTSGNDNHFAVTNLTAVDQSTDTCTNNFATINPLNTFPATPPTLSEGNLQCRTVNADPGYFGGSGTIGVSTGKWYFEVKPTVTTSGQPFFIGVSYEPEEMARQGATASAQYLAPTYLYYGHNGNKFNNGSNSSYGDSYAADDIVGVALDLDNHKLYFSKNGTFQNSGDPTTGSTGTGSAFNLTTGKTYFPVLADGGGSVTTYQLNFGSPPFAISSGNTDAEGFGNFEFAVPSGYFALCSKNLAEYGG